MGEPEPAESRAAKPRPGLRWAAAAIAAASLFLVLFNAESARSWTSELSPDPFTAQLRGLADGWKGATVRLDLDAPRAFVRSLWIQAVAYGWTGPGDPPRQAQR
jgi:hypothetical protein